MKKALSVILASLLAVGTFTACGTSDGASSTAPDASVADSASDALEDTAPKDGVTIRAVTSYGANDGNRVHYEAAYKAWEKETGNTVVDESEVSNEAWKSRILADFQTGSQGDIVFFFNGVDGNPLVEADKVVSLDEIIAEYPDFASNMDMTKIPDSPADGKKYAVPTTGYWEGMYVNKAVLEKAGAEMPGATTTWEEFLEICQTVKDAGFTPIAASLNEVPHYWFEFAVMNNIGQANHLEVPAAAGDKASKAWAGAFTDMKELYDMGFFPEDTNTASQRRSVSDDAGQRSGLSGRGLVESRLVCRKRT